MTYSKFFGRVVFPAVEFVNNTTIQKKRDFLRASQFWSKERIKEFQLQKLRNLLLHAYTQVPYYKRLFIRNKVDPSKISSLADLKKIPILTKSIIKKNGEDLRAKNYKNRSFAKFTSGSTGEPTKFYLTKEDYSWIWGSEFRAWSRAGFEFGDKYVKVSLNDDRSLWKKKMQDMLMRSMYIYAYKMKEEQVHEYIKQILRFRPKFIYGYSSALSIFAEFMLKNKIMYKAKAVFCTGDNLLDQYRKDISKAFNAKVFDLYGCGGEGLNIASQCEKGHYHINSELLICEVVDGQIVVTSLNNYAMPLIRYKPGDLVSLGSKKACNISLPIIKKLNGRSDDIIVTPRGDKLVVHFFTILFEYLQGIEKFKVIQEQKNGINIHIVATQHYDKKKSEKHIVSYIQKSVGKDFFVSFKYVDQIPFGRSGKFKFIESRL